MLEPARRWAIPAPVAISNDLALAGTRWALAPLVLQILARRCCPAGADVDRFLGPAQAALHDPALLPDAEIALARVDEARARGERVLVVGDFDADGLSGLVLLARALRRKGLHVLPYVPDRLTDGHGLPVRAVERAVEHGCGLIATVDCGTSSADEIAMAAGAGIDVIVTDHHVVPAQLPAPLALVNPRRPDSRYPERHLTGSGVAFKFAQLLLGTGEGTAAALDLADLATIGTVSDVAPLVGENRAIVQLGLELMRHGRRPGIAALLASAGVPADRLDVEALAYVLVPRLNAAGRMGDASIAARLLDAGSAERAAALADELEALNRQRRDAVTEAMAEAEAILGDDATSDPAVVVAGPWPIGIIGVVAGRLAEARGLPAVVISTAASPWRGSARGSGELDLAAAFAACAPHLVRFGGHPEAAGCDLEPATYPAFRAEFLRLATGARHVHGSAALALDAVVPAADLDYHLHRQLALLEPVGPGNPPPLLGVEDAEVTKVRSANGGHTQLTIRRGRDVVDAVAFGRSDLADLVQPGDHLDLAASLDSRAFGGYESLQLVVHDAGPAGLLAALRAEAAREGVASTAGAGGRPVGGYGAGAVG
jgi:single-stranded-DNA-specific exonuclease